MAVKPASQWGTNWQASAGRAQQNFAAGVEGYTGDWAGATVAQEGAMLQGVTQAVTNGSWRNGVSRVGTNGWKAATAAKAANFGVGFNAGVNKYNAAAAKLQPYLASAVASLPPRGDINQNLGRSAALAMALHSQRGNFKA